jgi:hypothetical protein
MEGDAVHPTTAEILNRVPQRLRNEYDAAWEAYASTCRMGGTPEERSGAYERARKMEDRMQVAVKTAADEHKRFLQRNAQHTA